MDDLKLLKKKIFENESDLNELIDKCLNNTITNYDKQEFTIYYKLLQMIENRNEELNKKCEFIFKILNLIILPVQKAKFHK